MRFSTGVQNGRHASPACDLQTLLDGGAYGSYGVASTFYTGALQTVTYHIPRYRFRGLPRLHQQAAVRAQARARHAAAALRPGGAARQDRRARSAIDPAELRLRIVAPPDTLTANYLRVGTIGLAECIRRVVAASGWTNTFGKLPHGRGLGLACSSYLSGAGLPIYWNDLPHSGVQLKLDRSGGVTAFCGATEIGQGSDDVLVACVAEVLGIDPFDVRVVTGDTDLTPVDLGSYSSRVTLMMGNAAIQAAERARDLLADAVSRQARACRRIGSCSPSGACSTRGSGDAASSFQRGGLPRRGAVRHDRHDRLLHAAEARRRSSRAAASARRRPTPTPRRSSRSRSIPTTGWIAVPRVWIAHDIGRALNPTLVRGQVEGSVYMGLGEALMEEQAFRRLPPRLSHALVHKFPSMLEYKSPTTLDMPEVVTELVEDPDPRGPFGAKEVGQGPLLPIMPAVANAVYDAVGVRIDEVPITPEKILKALAGEGRRASAARTARRRFPQIAWPEPLHVPPPWEGGDGTRDRTSPSASSARRTRASKPSRGARHDAPAPLPLSSRRGRVGEAAASLAGRRRRTRCSLAGGTDLLPNMKRRQQTPRDARRPARRSPELRERSRERTTGSTIGAGVTLTRARARRRACAERYAGLWQAAAQVATPHLRNMGTLGGNLCLDTRCNYYDQNYEWRKAIDFCMKKDGDDLLGRAVEPALPGRLVDRHARRRCIALGAHGARWSARPASATSPLADLYRERRHRTT